MSARAKPILKIADIGVSYGRIRGCADVSFDLYPGEVLGIVGESGSGKTTLLKALSAQLPPDSGTVTYRNRQDENLDIYAMSEPERRFLMRTDWAFVHQNPRDGLRMNVRNLVTDLGLAVVIVTHDLAVARLLAHRLMVMKQGHVVETGLTDQVLDDPQHPYSQLLVSSILQT